MRLFCETHAFSGSDSRGSCDKSFDFLKKNSSWANFAMAARKAIGGENLMSNELEWIGLV